MKFNNQTILITDPCYLINDSEGITDNDWSFCNYGSNMEALGLNSFMVSHTGVGDGCWNLYACDDPNAVVEKFRVEAEKVNQIYEVPGINEILTDMGQEFSADSGQTGVFDLAEVLAYNPFFKDDLPSNCYAVIENFTGDIDFEFVNTPNYNFLVVKGIGSTNFITL